MLNLYSFVLLDSLKMALRCRNIYEFDPCHELYFMIRILCILLGVFIG